MADERQLFHRLGGVSSTVTMRVMQFSGHDLGSHFWRHMFPESEYAPSDRFKVPVGLFIPNDVGSELVTPPLRIVPRRNEVFGTPVPEAPVNEDCNLGPREGDVHGSSWHTRNWEVDPVAEPLRMEQLPKMGLTAGVTAPLRTHATSYLVGGPQGNTHGSILAR